MTYFKKNILMTPITEKKIFKNNIDLENDIDIDIDLVLENDIDEHPRKVRSGNGIGLQNIIQRLKLTFGREDLISIGSENGKFLVTITFPQNGENDTSYTN